MNKLIYLVCLFTVFNSYSLPIDSLTKSQLESGILYMENSQFEKAIETFTEIMKPGVVLPNEVCYFMGYSLFQSGRKNYSVRFLDKYLELTDTSGVYFTETIDLLLQMGLENPYAAPEEIDSLKPFISVQDDPCQGKTDVLCPICNGTGVIIKKSKYGTVYKTCLYSDEHGLMDCKRYRSYLEGELIEYTPN